MASSNPNQTVTVNVSALSNALAVAIQQATAGTSQPQQPVVAQAGQSSPAIGSFTPLVAAAPSLGPSTSSSEAGNILATVGRPRMSVEVDEILELRKLRFTWTKIAKMLNISRSTLYRRLEEAGISPSEQTIISDHDLDVLVASIKLDHPNDGEVMMRGHLVRLEVNVSRESLRRSIHRVDSHGVYARSFGVIRRRIYSVPHPNYIWHLDSHHKLIRWHFVIHGAIDGFSRTIIYLKCADNNRANTVVHFFHAGVSAFGLPDQVRSDKGGENADVWRYMISSHGNMSAVVTGSSVHNERIERLWRDVHRSVVSSNSAMFRDMESEGVLDPLNAVDLYCLRYIFLPRIQKQVSEFQESWNNHALSSEGNMTPYQLMLQGITHIDCTDASTPNLDTNIDIQSLIGEHVDVPRHSFFPCTMLLQELQNINQLQMCTDNGKSLYNSVIAIVGQHLLLSCTNCTHVCDPNFFFHDIVQCYY